MALKSITNTTSSGSMIGKLFYFGPSAKTLHEQYAKRGRIDSNAPITTSSQLIIHAPVEQVWEVLINMREWTIWHPKIKMLELNSIAPDHAFTWKLGSITLHSTFSRVEPCRELSWTGTFFGYKAVDRHIVQSIDANCTRVIIEESLAGPLLPWVFSAAKLQAAHEEWLADLKKYVEIHLAE